MKPYAPEPWKIEESHSQSTVRVLRPGRTSLVMEREDAYRMVQCVNACASVVNPKAIPKLISAAVMVMTTNGVDIQDLEQLRKAIHGIANAEEKP